MSDKNIKKRGILAMFFKKKVISFSILEIALKKIFVYSWLARCWQRKTFLSSWLNQNRVQKVQFGEFAYLMISLRPIGGKSQ